MNAINPAKDVRCQKSENPNLFEELKICSNPVLNTPASDRKQICSIVVNAALPNGMRRDFSKLPLNFGALDGFVTRLSCFFNSHLYISPTPFTIRRKCRCVYSQCNRRILYDGNIRRLVYIKEVVNKCLRTAHSFCVIHWTVGFANNRSKQNKQFRRYASLTIYRRLYINDVHPSTD